MSNNFPPKTQEKSLFLWAKWASLGVFLVSLIYYYYLPHLAFSLDQWVFSSHSRLYLPLLYSYYDPSIFPQSTYIASLSHILDLPKAYQGFYGLMSYLIDPVSLSKILPYITTTAFVIIMAICSHRILGISGILITLWLGYSTPLFLTQSIGGLPQSFAFMCVALLLLAILDNRPYTAYVLTFLTITLYPPLILISCLASLWLLIPRALPLKKYSCSHFLQIFGLCFILVIFTIAACYLVDQIPYPTQTTALGENFSSLLATSLHYQSESLFGSLIPIYLLVFSFMLTCYSCFSLPSARRFLGFALLGLLLAYVSHLTSNFTLLDAMLSYGLPPILILMFIFAIKSVFLFIQSQLSPPPRYLFYLTISLCLLLTIPGKLTAIELQPEGVVSISPKQRPLYQFIQTLPKHVLIAGLPTQTNDVLNNIPYLSKRTVFTSSDLIQLQSPLGQRKQQQIKILIEGYFATDLAQLKQLHTFLGIDYLIIDVNDYTEPSLSIAPAFESFLYATRKQSYQQRKPFTSLHLLPDIAVYAHASLYVLDLKKLLKHNPI